MLNNGNIKDIYPLSPMQEGMYFHALYNPSSPAYFEQFAYRVRGKLNMVVFEQSLQALFDRHDVLRTVFNYQKADLPLQVVLKQRDAEWHFEALDELPEADREADVRNFKQLDRQRGFDLSRDVLMRVAVLQLDEELFEIVWSHHHILMDGWCVGILIAEFNQLYAGMLAGRQVTLPGIAPYRSYIEWLGRQDREEARSYWEGYLRDFEQLNTLPKTRLTGPGAAGYDGQRLSMAIGSANSRRLHQLAARYEVTASTILTLVWGAVVGKYGNGRDVVFGQVVSDRPAEIAGIETMIGLFINTLPVRIRWQDDTKAGTLLQQIHQATTAGKPYQYYSLADIQQQSAFGPHLIDHLIIIENYPEATQLEGLAGEAERKTRFEVIGQENFEQTNYDLNVLISGTDEVTLKFLFNGNAYRKSFIEGIGRQFTGMLGLVLDNPAIPLGELTASHCPGAVPVSSRPLYPVRLKGFCIDLGEIENVLQAHPAVGKATVVLNQDEKYLLACCTAPMAGERLTEAGMRAYLTDYLPAFMIPYRLLWLEQLPLTPDGETDRQMLRQQWGGEPLRERPFEAPANEVEVIITGIWQEVLDVDQISRNDNFFRIGGHSLKAMRILSRLQKKLSISINMIDIFNNPTVAQLSRVVVREKQTVLLP